MLTLLAYRGRFRLMLPYLIVAAWAIAEHFSPVQAAEPYVLRLIMINVVLIYPIHLLLEADEWNPALFDKAFQSVLVTGMLISVTLFMLMFMADGQGSLISHIAGFAVLGILYFGIARGWLNQARLKLGVTAKDPAVAEKMTEISDHLVSVLDDLRFVIKPDQAKMADEKAVKLFITIDKIAASLSVLLEQNGQAIKTITQGQLPTVLKFNVQLVRQIVTNLVKNASIHSGAS